jgi:K+-sensing histidine kinase KdpD
MPKLPVWVRVLVLPIAGCGLATLITWKLWPFIQPSASPLFFPAVMISALYGGVVAGLIATLLSAATTAYLFMTPQFSMAIDHSDIFRLVVFAAVALLTSWIGFQRNRTDEQQQRLVTELRAANARIRTLSDMLPICPDCRRVRVGDNTPEWKTVESYLADTPELHLSHALCPECSARHFPEFHAPTV